MENSTFLTIEGKNILKKELEQLKTVERLTVAKLIGEAKSFGDLRENSEYDSAKNREAQVEMRIFEIENILKNAVIISKDDIDTSKVNIGCFVKILDKQRNNEVEYKIMGEHESDPMKKIISNVSPLGSALMHKRVNEEIEVETPSGKLQFKILSITA